MRHIFLAAVLMCQCAGTTAQQTQPSNPADAVKYEAIAEGVQAAALFRTDALRDVIVDVRDVIVGPGRSAPNLPSTAFVVTELKSGEIETAIDGQATRRRPGAFWLVSPGQKYGIRSLGGMAVLHTVTFTKP